MCPGVEISTPGPALFLPVIQVKACMVQRVMLQMSRRV